jgi:hypothetical protein
MGITELVNELDHCFEYLITEKGSLLWGFPHRKKKSELINLKTEGIDPDEFFSLAKKKGIIITKEK